MKSRTAAPDGPEDRRMERLQRDNRREQAYTYDRTATAPRGGAEMGDLSTPGVLSAYRHELVTAFFEHRAAMQFEQPLEDAAREWLCWRLKCQPGDLEPVVWGLFVAGLRQAQYPRVARTSCRVSPLEQAPEARELVAVVKSLPQKQGEGNLAYVRRIAVEAKLMAIDEKPLKDIPAPIGVVAQPGVDWREENVTAIFGPKPAELRKTEEEAW